MTPAAVSALECSGLEAGAAAGDLTPEERILVAAVSGGRLIVTPETQAPIASALNELSNAEDAEAERRGARGPDADPALRRAARGACIALGALALRVSRIPF